MKVNFHLIADTTFVIAVHRGDRAERVGWLQTDKLGRARVSLDTLSGNVIPVLQEKNMVKLWHQNQDVMFGRLSPVE